METGTIYDLDALLWANDFVSMKSGLGDRNNTGYMIETTLMTDVSMKSGLGDRNNFSVVDFVGHGHGVSMKSGLGDRNN